MMVRRTRVGPDGHASVQIKVARWLRDGLFPGLLQRFLESARQRVTAGTLRLDRLFEQRLAAGFGLFKDAMGIVELWLIGSLDFNVADDAPEAGVNDQG